MTTTNPFTRSGVFSTISDELDPPPERLALARRRYEDLGNWMQQHAAASDRAVRVYPQGSYNLGTTNRDPVTDEFDFDLVICVEYDKSEISQRELNGIVNGWLGSYVASRKAAGGELAPKALHKGKRAWTIEYEDPFHMDILPVVPDLAGDIVAEGGEPSWLTDKELVRWQPTNPQGFANHFRRVSYDERLVLAQRAQIDVADLPPEGGPKTTLQMVVKLLKRHRDHAFADDHTGMAPPSALITALATRAYEKATPGGGEMADVISAVVMTMPDMQEELNGELVVSNPTYKVENYADRYTEYPAKRKALMGWLAELQSDVALINRATGLPRVRESVDKAFGEGVGERIAKRLGESAIHVRDSDRLKSSAAGTLGVAGASAGLSHRPHTFYGDEDGKGSA